MKFLIPTSFLLALLSVTALTAQDYIDYNETTAIPTCMNPADTTGPCGPCCNEPYKYDEDSGSLMLNSTINYYGWANEYKTPSIVSSCAPCGGGSGSNGTLPSLELTRFYHIRGNVNPFLSFGSLTGLENYDVSFRLLANQDAIIYYPLGKVDEDRVARYDASRGLWAENGRRGPGFYAIQLYTLAGTPITTKADRDLAHTAIMLNHDGTSTHFEIFWKQDGNGWARPIAFMDRHGNAIETTYTDAHFDTVTNPVLDVATYFKKDKITDAYSREATFSYIQAAGKNVVDKITFPNGEEITYQYGGLGTIGNPMVKKAIHPDGSETTYSFADLTTSHLTVLTVNDVHADLGSRRKTLYFTKGYGINSSGQTVTAVRNRIRNAANGEGETTYASRIGTSSDERYIYSGGNMVKKMTYIQSNYGMQSAGYISNTLWQGDFHQGDTTTWNAELPLGSRVNDSARMPIVNTGSRSHVISYTRDPITTEITATTHPDATASATTRNVFNQPLTTTDRLGRTTTRTYSPLGNLLTETRATATADETTTTYVHNTRGQVIEERDALYDPNYPELHNTRYEYDTNGFLIKKIEAADIAAGTRPETLYTYDTAGRLATTTDPVGRTVTYTYDLQNRVIETLYADTSTELIEYGTGLEANLIVKTTDRNGYETTYQYDAADRRIETVTATNTSDPSTEICTYLVGTRLKETCTIDGEKTEYAYDYRNQLIATTRHADANTTLTNSSEIDILGRTRSTTDAYGRRTFYLYDQNDRISRTVTETVPNGLGTVPAFSNDSSQTAEQIEREIELTNSETITLEGIHEVTYTDARDLFLQNLTRDLDPNAPYLITDRLIDAEGQTLTTTDARGIETLQIHDTLGRTIRSFEAITLPEERLTEMDYDDASNVAEVRHPRHFVESIEAKDTFTYNGRNLRATHTTAPGSAEEATQSWTYYLDGRGNQHTDFRGNIAQQIWHTCCGRLQASVDRDGQSTTIYNTDRKGQPIHTATVTTNPGSDWTDPVDADTLQETTTRFDGRGRPTHTTVWLQPLGDIGTCCGGSGTNPIPIAGLDSVPAAEGLTTSYTYDDDLTDGIGIDNTHAAALASLAASGTVFGPGSTGSAIAITNPEGETTVRISDGLGRTAMTIDPEGNTSIISYDEIESGGGFQPPSQTPIPGDLLATSMTDPNGNTSTSYTDGAGRTLASEDAAGNIVFSGYDANSNQLATRDPNGLGQDCEYDALNRDTTCADLQEQNQTTFRSKEYNAASQVVTSTDAEGKVTTMEYDVRNRLTSTTDPNLIEVTYAYDPNNNLTELTDGENHTRTWSYNSRNLVTEKQYPGNAADDLEYAYDALRRLSVKVDQQDDTVYHVYDLAGRLIEKQYRIDGTTPESTDTFTYDGASRLLTTTKGRYGVTTAHTWNADSTPASESFTADGRTYLSSRSYDVGNRPTAHSYPDTHQTVWTYDARNLVQNVQYQSQNGSNVTLVAAQTFDDASRLTGQTLGNGLSRTIAYGRADNLRTTDATFDGATALDDLDFGYSYEIDKQVAAENVTSDLVPDTSFTASYDDGNRVTGWDRPSAPGTIRNTQSWAFDDAGNWDSTTIDSTTENRSHNAADKITLINGNAVTNDDKGNLLAFTHAKPTLIGNIDTDYILEWDLDNRLKKTTVENDDVEYRYDALGRRVLRKEGTDETALIWWGDSECAEYEHATGQACIQNDIFCHPTQLNTVVARAVDGDENDLQWYHKNYLDHVYAVSDDTGDLIEHYRYSAFGEIEIFDELGNRILASAINNQITWNTRRLDTLSGFYLYKYRHYSPQLGRWPSRDPIEEYGGINLYGFVGNDGVNHWDYLGQMGQRKPRPEPPKVDPDEFDYWEAYIDAGMKGTCGKGTKKIIWVLGDMSAGGHIFQQVSYDGWWKYCEGKGYGNTDKQPISGKYTEWWSFNDKNSITYLGTDEVGLLESKGVCTKGEVTFTLKARLYINSRGLPEGAPAEESGRLPSVDDVLVWPGAGDLKNEISRKVVVKWNCCDGKNNSTEVE